METKNELVKLVMICHIAKKTDDASVRHQIKT